MSEDIFADQLGAGWSLDLVDAPSRILPEIHRRAVWFYLKSVRLYTAREISRDGDILAAYKGISNLMEATLHAPFIFGLPSSHFDLALLWEGGGSVKRRDDSNFAVEGDTKFPSWSWCGWKSATMDYHPGMVGDCVANLNEWLLNHTWIYWFIRDGRGDLRPIWPGEDGLVDESTEVRWRGYGATTYAADVDGHREPILMYGHGECRPYHHHHQHHHHHHHHHVTILQATMHSALFTPRTRLKKITARFILGEELYIESVTTTTFLASSDGMNVIRRERLFEKAAKVSITLLEAKTSITGAFLKAKDSISLLEAKASITGAFLNAKASITLLRAPESSLEGMRLQITTGYVILASLASLCIASPSIQPIFCRNDTSTSVLEIGNMTTELRKAILNKRQIHFRPPCRSNLADGKTTTSTSMAAVFQ
jgi:hypothetical protein